MTVTRDGRGAVKSSEGLHCPRCDYDLRGLPEDRCPECGIPFDASDPFCYPDLIRMLYRREVFLALAQLVGGSVLAGTLLIGITFFGSLPGTLGIVVEALGAVAFCIILVIFSRQLAIRVDSALALRARRSRSTRAGVSLLMMALLIPLHLAGALLTALIIGFGMALLL